MWVYQIWKLTTDRIKLICGLYSNIILSCIQLHFGGRYSVSVLRRARLSLAGYKQSGREKQQKNISTVNMLPTWITSGVSMMTRNVLQWSVQRTWPKCTSSKIPNLRLRRPCSMNTSVFTPNIVSKQRKPARHQIQRK